MKKTLALILVGLMVFSSMAIAREMEDPVTGAVKTVGRAAKGTVDTAVSPIKAIGDGEPENVVVAPIKTGGETVYNAAVDTGKTATMQKVDMDD